MLIIVLPVLFSQSTTIPKSVALIKIYRKGFKVIYIYREGVKTTVFPATSKPKLNPF